MHENEYEERKYMKSAAMDYDRLPAEFIREGYLATRRCRTAGSSYEACVRHTASI